MNDEEINAFVHDQHVKINEVMTERIKAETLAERRFSAAVSAMQGILSGGPQSSFIRPDELASDAINQADALLAALEEKK